MNLLAKLETNVAEIEKANARGDLARVAELDSAFHNMLAQATNNHYLTDTITGLHRAFSRFGYIAWQRNQGAGESLDEHRTILAAVKQGEHALARQLTRTHVLAARDRIVEAISGQTLTTFEDHEEIRTRMKMTHHGKDRLHDETVRLSTLSSKFGGNQT